VTGHSEPRRPAGTLPERSELGRQERSEAPRSAHGDWAACADRRDPVARLEEQDAARLPELLPIRYGRMLASPLAFFRGAPGVMAADLAPEVRTGLDVQLCGDAQLANFGVLATPDGRPVLALEEFEETLPGPFEWDLKRLVASFAVAGRERGLPHKQRSGLTLSAAAEYRHAMRELATLPALEVWYARRDAGDLEGVAGAALTAVLDGEPRIVADPPAMTRIEDLVAAAGLGRVHELARGMLAGYAGTLAAEHRRLLERFRYADAAREVAGVAGVGTRTWILLLVGSDGAHPLLLRFKEAGPSVLEPFLGPSGFDNHGHRVVEGRRLMQATGDLLLGWVRAAGPDGAERDYAVHRLRDRARAAGPVRPDAMLRYAKTCGWTLAQAHARSGDPAAIAGYLGSGDVFDRAMAAFAERYADQNERDHAALRDAVTCGRITAETGV
jgi:uncharacterized protein (DUF2252 family)